MQHAQNLGLRRHRHIADFVQKNGAAGALLEFANALGGGAREGALFVPEQFALQQVLRYGGAVDGQKGQAAAFAVMIDGARDQLFASAALAGNQGGGVAARQLPDGFENILHGLAPPDDPDVVILRLQQRLVRDDLSHVARGFERVEHD